MTETSFIGTSDPEHCDYHVSVCNGGTSVELNPRLNLRNHSPTGFSWGYNGSGPAQLALAMLAYATDDEQALKHYQRYKAECVSSFPKDWQIPISVVRRWVRKQSSPYGSWCIDPDLCEGLGHCPRDPNCGD